jgi:hypothetical protein
VKRSALALGIWLASSAISIIAVALIATSWDAELPRAWGFRGFTATFAVLFGTVGLLIVRRQPAHLVGWLLLVAGSLSAVQQLAEEYLIASFFTRSEPLPGASWIGWLNAWIWVPIVNAILLVPVIFPGGRVVAGSRPIVATIALAAAMTITGAVASPDQITTNMRGVPPPYDPRDLGVLAEMSGLLFNAGFGLMSLAALGAAVSVAGRFRRAGGIEREQIKWFAYGSAAVGVTASVNVVAQVAATIGSAATYSPLWDLAQYALIVAMWLVPVSIGIAVLRYRLYDIDRLIDRTIVYAVVSAILGATYVATVVSFQAVLRPITGGSELAVAVSTLLVVALFQPIRTRVQDAVDRRFYRSRYDAGRTLDAFTARLRGDVDLDSVRTDLVSVLHETVRPTHASVWLREGQG